MGRGGGGGVLALFRAYGHIRMSQPTWMGAEVQHPLSCVVWLHVPRKPCKRGMKAVSLPISRSLSYYQVDCLYIWRVPLVTFMANKDI